MPNKEKAAGEGLISPAAHATASKAMPGKTNRNWPDMPAFGFAATHAAARYGLPLPWAAIIAVAAGLGECAR